MNFLGNIAWLILGGLITSVLYIISGLVFCVTIIGIPFGVQLMKLGAYAFWPFGKTVELGAGEPGCLSLAGNIIWILLGWWEIALTHIFFGLIFCITIVGIPFGMKHFQLAKMSVFPFGQHGVRK